MSDGAVPGAKLATLSSETLPSLDDGTVSAAMADSVVRFSARARRWTSVLLAAFVVGRHLVAAHQQPQRFGGVANLHAKVRRLRSIEPHRDFRLADVERRVEVDDARQRFDARHS